MIPRCAGWTRRDTPGAVTLTHKDGPAKGLIRYRERVRPLRTLGDQLEELLAIPRLTGAVVEPVLHLTTLEGEAGAMVRVRATWEGDVAIRFVLGGVTGDDFVTALAAHTIVDSELDALSRTVFDLLVQDRLGLGVRRRRLVHAAPPGWTAHADAMSTDWLAPDGDAVIRVFPVEPATGEPDPLASLVATTEAAGRRIDWIDGAHDLAVQPGLLAATWRIGTSEPGGQAAACCDLVVLRDARYEYATVLESRAASIQDRHRVTLHGVAASITPLAPFVTSEHAAVAALAHWAS